MSLSRSLCIGFLCFAAVISGCAAPQYSVRQAPAPNEAASILKLEREISNMQAAELAKEGTRPIGQNERVWGFDVNGMLRKLAAATERPHLPYQGYLLQNEDPNAAALADGRIFVTTGLLKFLSQRPNGEAELAFVLSHELAHTVAQHLIQRYERLQRQSIIMTMVAVGTSRIAAGGAADAARIAQQVAGVLNELALNGYSQEQELEADQLGLRYMKALGLGPEGALSLLEGFQQFDAGVPFLRTHPYASLRREYLERYLSESQPAAHGHTGASAHETSGESRASRIKFLRSVQATYPKDSVSWKNLEKQIKALESGG